MQFTRIDSKGRVSIPSSMRNYMGIENGDSFIVTTGKKGIKLLPVSNNGNVEMEMRFSSTEVLVDVINVLARNKIKIVSSSGLGDRWQAVLDMNGSSERKIAKKISSMKNVRHVKTRCL